MHAWTRTILWVLPVVAGCTMTREPISLPTDDSLVRDQLVIFSDFRLPRHHRLVEDLVACVTTSGASSGSGFGRADPCLPV